MVIDMLNSKNEHENWKNSKFSNFGVHFFDIQRFRGAKFQSRDSNVQIQLLLSRLAAYSGGFS